MERINLHEKIMVSVRCAVYNHGNYLRKCLEGFVMQKATFLFEVIVHDDASTDSSAEIIREYESKYPKIIKPIYEKENQYSKDVRSMNLMINNHLTGKYVAICEGDDYWTDPYKLQKQVDFLEAHPDYSMCYHPVNYISENGILKNDQRFHCNRTISVSQIIKGGGYYCATASLVFRNCFYHQYPNWRKMSDVGDFPLQIQLALSGKIYYMNEIMGCYRCFSTGSWSANEKKVGKFNMKHYENAIEWLTELNQATNGKYRTAIHLRLVMYLFKPLRYKQFSRERFIAIYGQINPFKLKFKEFIYYLKILFYLNIPYCEKLTE